MQIELVNHGKIEAEAGAPLIAVIAAADKELAKKACVAKINGQLADLRTVPADGDTVEVFGPQDEEGLRTLRHTASHVMAQAASQNRLRAHRHVLLLLCVLVIDCRQRNHRRIPAQNRSPS